jgi:hypothetical protein
VYHILSLEVGCIDALRSFLRPVALLDDVFRCFPVTGFVQVLGDFQFRFVTKERQRGLCRVMLSALGLACKDAIQGVLE